MNTLQKPETKTTDRISRQQNFRASGQLLDSLGTAQANNQYSYELAEILSCMSLKPTMMAFQILADELSNLAHHQPTWGKKYIHSVYHCKIEPSPELAHAIDTMAQIMDGAPIGIAGAAYIKVLAQPGQFSDGVYVKQSLVEKHCPGCGMKFIGPGKYHDPACGREYRRKIRHIAKG